MKRTIIFVLLLCLAAALTGCMGVGGGGNLPWMDPYGQVPFDLPTEAPRVTAAPLIPTEAPSYTFPPVTTEIPFTEAPQYTDVPQFTSAPEITPVPPTDPPAATGIPDYCVKIAPNTTITADIDFDGLPDTIKFKLVEGEYDYEGYVKVTRGANPDSSYKHEIDYCYDAQVYVVDCDPTDSRLEILINYVYDSEDYTFAALRVNDSGSRIKEFECWYALCISEDDPFTSEDGFPVQAQCDVLGTRFLDAYCKVTSKGFEPSTAFYFGSGDWIGEMEVKKDLPAVELYDNGYLGNNIVIPRGEIILPAFTDMESYVVIEREDGTFAYMDISYGHDDDWGVYLNGVNQDEYFDIMYAD